MKQRKLKLSVAAVAALGCMGSTAFAMEHDFNGLLRIKGDLTNFDQAGGNDASVKAGGLRALYRANPSSSFFYSEQRARLKYTGKFSDDVKLVTQFEIDSRWGDSSQGKANLGSTRNGGGAMETDQVNLETKNVYMDFKIPTFPTQVKAGLMPFDDAYKGVFLTTDIAGVMTTTKLDNMTINAGWLRGYDNVNFNGADGTLPAVNTAPTGTGSLTGFDNPGKYSLDIGILEAKYAVSKELSVGGSYYLTYSNLEKSGYNILSTVGVNASYNFGPGTIDGFLLFQAGDNPTNDFGQVGQSVSAFAANIAGKIKAGPGTARGTVLYASGDDGKGSVSAFQCVNQLGDGNATSTFSSAQMTMLITNTRYAANTDRALINTVTNYNQGIVGAFFGYDLDINKTFIKTNIGFGSTASDNNTFKPKNLTKNDYSNGKYVGTEVNAEVGYKISSNLTASVIAGYVKLGDYYKDTVKNTVTGAIETPDNPWKSMVVLNLSF
jgi:hypothetical protein